ncbi:MAG TPA: NADH-quinone oxidoreductase subunit L [Actinobacteria bacterium]|nr:NADH-quinone oxidoreductase subunit L [bacterium BMS3Bbin01]HDH26952.1 NADH-quinone oxidoreductase subunit L [Actinomycetota bacterium]
MIPQILASEGIVQATTGGWLAQWAWLIVVVPFLAMLAIISFGKRMPREGGEIAVGAMGFVFVYATVLLILNITQGVVYEHSIQVAQIGSVTIEWGWVVDGLSTMMYFVVGTLSFLVFTYALGYMKGDVRVTWFFAAFTFFAGSMLVLVSAPNLIQLIVGWEGVGLASYLLIGHYWEQKENSSAGMKAFYTNKIADIGLIIGAIILGTAVGSFRYSNILDAAAANAAVLQPVAVLGGVLLFIGAMGKSAQFPFHVWLPDAMAGPTPVSSLMHAATMVTAGVYLIARMYPLYAGMAADMRVLIVVIGTVTLFIAGLLAIVQDDLKRVLAYSTVSQLGYMVAALGAGGYTAGLFHLWTHAFFKGLLFLTAGSVIHAVHSNNMSDMGGLRKKMPVTFWSFTSATLALVAIIPFAGFFSKDEILATLGQSGYRLAMWVGILGAFITAFYMGRAMFLTFFGTYKGHAHVHESPAVMAVPMAILGVAALVAGWVNIPGIYEGFHEWVTVRAIAFPSFAPEGFDVPVMLTGLGFALAGLIIAYFIYYRDADTQVARDRVRIPVLWPFLEHKYYLDDLYLAMLINPIKGPIARAVDWSNSYIIDGIVNGAGVLARLVARFVYRDLDQKGIDLAVNTAAIVTGSAGGQVRRLQTGKVQQYAAMTLVGVALLVIAIVIFT